MDVKLRSTFFRLFALSGFAGLIYESIWSHYVKLFLGHAAYAQTLVLAIFMGGMAIGSWLCGKYSARWKNLLMGYAVVEGVIGLFALFFHTVFDNVVQLSYTAIIPHLGSAAAATVYQWALSTLLILPQSILIGMPFPLMSAGILRMFPQNPGRSLATLYFTNSIGAAVGVLVSSFLLIPLAGLPGAIRAAGLINMALCLIVWRLANKYRSEPFSAPPAGTTAECGSKCGDKRFYLIAALVTGTASFIYEIGWIRMLCLVLGSSTHAFELMLSAFILGLAFGGLWIQRRIDRIANPLRYLVPVQIVMGLLALATLPLYGNTFAVMQWLLKTLGKTNTGYVLFNLSSYSIALAVMLPATFCAGMTLPLITYAMIRRGHGERSIGGVYAANTVGAIVGIFFAVHVGMPLVGVKGVITAGAAIDMALGLALVWGTAQYAGKRLPAALTMLCLFALAATVIAVVLDPYKMASGVYRHGDLLSTENSRLLYHRDGKTATVSLALRDGEMLSIRTNGKVDASVSMQGEATPDEATMILAAAIPMALNPQARTAANIGLGSGLTTSTLLHNRLLEHVDTVEIEESMVEAARNFGPRSELVYTDPRSDIHMDDAKSFFAVHNQRYDIIVSEPSNPWVSGVANLFSEEFYRLINRHLTANGLFVQWFQLYEIDMNLVASVLKAVSANFSDYALYAPHIGDLLIIAKKDGAMGNPDPGLFDIPGLAGELRRVGIESLQDIEVRRIGNRQALDKLLETFPIRANSDYYPVLEQNAARTRFLNVHAGELLGFSHDPLPSLEILTGFGLSCKETRITPSPFFPKSEAAYIAMALRDYFLYGSFSPKYGAVPTDIREQAVQFRRIFHEPGSVPEQDVREECLFSIAGQMVPHLRSHELDAVWKRLDSGAAAQLLTPLEKGWVSFFKAVGRRDPVEMTTAAGKLLEKGRQIPPHAAKYLLASAMLGSVVQGDRKQSLRFWSDYQRGLFGSGRPELVFQILLANSRG